MFGERGVYKHTGLVWELARMIRGLSTPYERVEACSKHFTNLGSDVPLDDVPVFVLDPYLPDILIVLVLSPPLPSLCRTPLLVLPGPVCECRWTRCWGNRVFESESEDCLASARTVTFPGGDLVICGIFSAGDAQ